MKLTVLGKYGPYPEKGKGAASGYLISDGKKNILLDMGSGVLSRLTSVIDLHNLDGIIISHLHFDHTSDLLPLKYLLEEKNITLNVYVQRQDTPYYEILFKHPLFNVIDIDSSSNIKIGDFDISFYDMAHPVPTLAIKIKEKKTLYFTSDTVMNKTLLDSSKDCDYILADCSKPAGFNGPHMTVIDAITLQQNSGATILATHQNPGSVPDFSEAAYKNTFLVEEMQTYSLD